MTKICIQAGHSNIISGETGAPGEQAFNLDVANQVSGELRRLGFEVLQTDANANKDPKVTGQDWDLFLAIHYDADIYNDSGGFIDVPKFDYAAEESKRIAQHIKDSYFTITGIKEIPTRSNPKTYNYYMWSALSNATPCVIIECGVGWRVPKDSDVLNSEKRTTLVVPGIVKGICQAFGVAYLPTPPDDPCKDLQSLFTDIKVVLYGKGWPWTKINEIKAILPK